MRTIDVSTDVFARIWSLRREGENSEDAILRRLLLGTPGNAPSSQIAPATCSLIDRRYGVQFPEGFVIERTYLGTPYRAEVRSGQWVLQGREEGFTRLNELSRAIGTRTENAWANWFYVNADGERRPVSELRDPATIRMRAREAATAERFKEEEMSEKIRWCDDIRTALQELGGQGSLRHIYKKVAEIRRKAGRSIPPTFEECVRTTLHDYSSDSDSFKGDDWFAMPEGKGRGYWSLRSGA